MNVPIVDYRFGDCHYVTSFITPDNPDIQDLLQNIPGSIGAIEGDAFVERVATYISNRFEYPLIADSPSCDGQLLRYTEGVFKHKFKCCRFYVWAFPAEVLQSGYGYCAETGNLAESLLVNRLDAWAVLGDVMDLNEMLLGRHEWVEVPYKGETYILETTIHREDINNLVTAASVYNRDSDWAKQGKLYYVPKAWFNEAEYKGEDQFASLMSLPAKRVFWHGVEETRIMKAKKLAKELRNEQRLMEELIIKAWGG